MAFAHFRRRRAPLHWFVLILPLCLAANGWAQAPVAVSADMKRLLDANAWQLEYQISFKASGSGTAKLLQGSMDYQTSLSWDASETISISSRSQGASIAMRKLTKNLSNPAAAANMQKAMMDIVMQSDNIASWMATIEGAAELGDEELSAEKFKAFAEAQAKKESGKVTLDYSEQRHGEHLVTEIGTAYKQTVRTTRRGTGAISPNGQQITLEVNAATKRFSLALPVILPLVQGAMYTEETVSTTQEEKKPKPEEERETRTAALEYFPGKITVTDAALSSGDGGVITEDPIVLQGGKLSGQRTTTATYVNSNDTVAGTLVLKYTLTPR